METLLGELFAVLLFSSSVFAGVHATGNRVNESEYHLLEDLFDPQRYNRRVRPVLRSEDPVNVTFGLVVKEIEDLDDKNQLLITRAEIRESWLDPLLAWNPSAYGGTEFISIQPNRIWLPDVVLYNNAGEGFGSGMTRTKAFISHDGVVSLNVPTIIKSSCKIHVDNYPFDQQNCDLKFGSWTYDAAGIALTLEKPTADLSDYSPSVAWELMGVPGVFHSIVYTCCPQPYHDVTYTVRIKRRALYYAMYLIIPCAMISVLTLLVFLLPPDCNERMTVGMAILVGLSFFFLLVAENMPATSEAVPLVGVYYTVTMIEVSCAFFMTCWVLRFHHHNPTEGEVPNWVRVYLLGYGARIFRFHFGDNSSRQTRSLVKDGQDSSVDSIPPPILNDKQQLVAKKTLDSKQEAAPGAQTRRPGSGDKRSANTILAENIRHQMVLEARQDEWRKAALVLNHICIWVFIFAVVVSFLAIFLRAPL